MTNRESGATSVPLTSVRFRPAFRRFDTEDMSQSGEFPRHYFPMPVRRLVFTLPSPIRRLSCLVIPRANHRPGRAFSGGQSHTATFDAPASRRRLVPTPLDCTIFAHNLTGQFAGSPRYLWVSGLPRSALLALLGPLCCARGSSDSPIIWRSFPSVSGESLAAGSTV